MYMKMNESSNIMPNPLMVIRRKFSQPELTTGKPYQVYNRQLNRAMMYGIHENSSVLRFAITLLKVNLQKHQKKIKKMIESF